MTNIYLTGFMGSGKSTVGKLVSKVIKAGFVDMDEAVSYKMGMPVAEIFEKLGEDAFRKAESAVLRSLSRRHNLVVATGGGVYEIPENIQLIAKSGKSVFLDAALKTIKARLGEDETRHRPLWKKPSDVDKLFRRRLPSYKRSDFTVKVDELTPQRVCATICNWVFPGKEFVVNYEGCHGRVVASWDCPGLISDFSRGRKAVLLTDHNVERWHLSRYLEVLGQPVLISLRPGEKSKSIRAVTDIYRKLLQNTVGRGDLLICLGGGVVTDIGGYVASTFKRGMDFILVGTSMVACVDAAIGGKSAIDVGDVKNSVGLFTKPLMTALDLSCLHTLKKNQIKEGLIEAYKTGLVANADLYSYMTLNIHELINGSIRRLCHVLTMSAETKSRIVSKDFREKDLRRILNLGHTYGHAVESFHNYSISHGRAISIGMQTAIHLSEARGFMDSELAMEAIKTIKNIFPHTANLPSASQAWTIMLNDKKNRDGKISFVLVRGKGVSEIVDDVTEQELDSAIKKLREINHE